MTTIPAGSASSTQTAADNAATASKANATLTSNQFLTLLTTQLTNQNPLDPTDPNQFTQEMVQYGQLSQQIDTNQTLTSIQSNIASLLTQVQLLAGGSSTSSTQSSTGATTPAAS